MTANATQEKKDATQEAECTSFDALGLNQEIMGAVEELGYTAPTPVQAGGNSSSTRRPRRACRRTNGYGQNGSISFANHE